MLQIACLKHIQTMKKIKLNASQVTEQAHQEFYCTWVNTNLAKQYHIYSMSAKMKTKAGTKRKTIQKIWHILPQIV